MPRGIAVKTCESFICSNKHCGKTGLTRLECSKLTCLYTSVCEYCRNSDTCSRKQ